MASGNLLNVFMPQAAEFPVANYPAFDSRGASFPLVCLQFDAAVQEAVVFRDILPPYYSGGGVNVSLYWCAFTAITGNVRWQALFSRLWLPAGPDIDFDSFATAVAVVSAAQTTAAGQLSKATMFFANGLTFMQSLQAGEMFKLQVARVAADGTDTMVGDASLIGVEIYEA